MEVDIEDPSCISLTSSDDGSLRSERLSIASDSLSFENACILYRFVPTDGNLRMLVTGTGLCLVSISNGEKKGIPLYMLKLRHTSSVDILFHLKKHGKQVISTFNNESLETGVDPSNPTLAKLTILEGQFINSFTLNGVIVQKQIYEMAKGEPPLDNSGIKTTEKSSFSNDVDETIAKITEEKEANDDKGDISSGIDDCNDNNSDAEKITADFQAVTANEGVIHDTSHNRDSQQGMEDAFNKAEAQHLLDHISPNFRDVDICIDDFDDDDVPWILVSGSDDTELNMPESTNDKFAMSCDDVPTRKPAVYGYHQSKGNFNKAGAVVKGRPQNLDIVDIRTNRTELINSINSQMLADYLFEAQLISEYDMNEVKEIWKREIHTEANKRLLEILRTREVSYRDMKVVLEKAEDQFLLELLFPKYQGIERAESNIDDADCDDIRRNSVSCNDDRESYMSESMLSADVPTGKPGVYKCNRGQDNCSKEGAMVKGRPENLDNVDIRTNRTDLLYSMTSRRLADYLFEAQLISEYNMKEVKEIWKKESHEEANGRLLEMLRNKRVSYREMEVVLEKAEEIHLLKLMFPKYQDMKGIERFTDDTNDKPLITDSCSDDRESIVSEATTDEYFMLSADVLNNDEKGEPVSGKPNVCRCHQNQCCCSKEGEKVKRQPENLGIVDIRTHRTDLMNIMNSSMLANYFFEGELISENDMNEVDEIWKKESYIEANERLLRILRNKKVPKRKIEVILYRAEEQHLSEFMFPKQLNFGSVQPKQEIVA